MPEQYGQPMPAQADVRLLERYHKAHDDSFGFTRYLIESDLDIMSYYDNDENFRVVIELDDRVIAAGPADIERLSDAIKYSGF